MQFDPSEFPGLTDTARRGSDSTPLVTGLAGWAVAIVCNVGLPLNASSAQHKQRCSSKGPVLQPSSGTKSDLSQRFVKVCVCI